MTSDEKIEFIEKVREVHEDYSKYIKTGNKMQKLNVASAILNGGILEAVHFCLELVRNSRTTNEVHSDLTVLLNYMVHECK